MIYIFLVVYSILILIVGSLIPKKGSDFKEYFFAGNTLSWRSFAFTLSATWFGASSILVVSKETYSNGLSSIWIMIAPSILTLLIFLIFSDRIRNEKVFSIPDILFKSYGRIFHFLSSITIFLYLLILSSSQAVALGNVFSEFLSLDYNFSIALGISLVFFYSFRGGLISVVKTDVIQLVFLLIGLLLIIINLISISVSNPFFSFTAGKDFFNPFINLKTNLLITLSFTFAWFISPVVWQRIISAKSYKDAKKGIIFTLLFLILLFSLPTFIGILERHILEKEPSSELITFLLKNQLGKFVQLFAFLAIISAIMSTLDSILNSSALTLTRDIGKIFKVKISGKFSLLISAFLTFFFSFPFKDILLLLGLSSQVLICSFFIPLLFTIIFKLKVSLAGNFSLLSGLLFSFLSYFKSAIGLPLSLPSWPYSSFLGIGISLLFFILGLIIQIIQGKIRKNSIS
ncbi:MAG: sodium:solute symporter family protein [Candidatus Aminicenantia bacterium]